DARLLKKHRQYTERPPPVNKKGGTKTGAVAGGTGAPPGMAGEGALVAAGPDQTGSKLTGRGPAPSGATGAGTIGKCLRHLRPRGARVAVRALQRTSRTADFRGSLPWSSVHGDRATDLWLCGCAVPTVQRNRCQ